MLKGKDTSGSTIYYSVDIFGAVPESIRREHGRPFRNLTSDKEMKLALGVDGAHVIYSGHSNFGLGPNFKYNATRTVDDYMNLSNGGGAAIAIRSQRADGQGPVTNPMQTDEHGGPAFALRPGDTKGTVDNPWIDLTTGYHARRFPISAASIPQIPASGNIPAYHFTEESEVPADLENPAYTKREWIAIVGSSGDVPVLRYGSLFMASCSSGRHFGQILSRKPFFYTRELSSSLIDIEDWDSLKSKYASPYVSYIYLDRLIQGKTLESTATFLNSVRYDKGGTSSNHFSVSR